MKSTVKALIIFVFLTFATPAFAALVNINIAGLDELDTLPGIGPAKAQAIIDYRTQNGPFETKEELLQVSGIGEATYDGLKDLITISGEGGTQDSSSTKEESESSTDTHSSDTSGSSSKDKTPVKATRIVVDGAAVAGAPVRISAVVTDIKGATLTYGVRYRWNFGDGTVGSEAAHHHIYPHPGTYLVVLDASYDDGEVHAEVSIDVVASGITLSLPGDGSVSLTNIASEWLDIGGWMLIDENHLFTIPLGTKLGKDGEIRFARSTTGLQGTINTKLLFPNGTEAAAVESSIRKMVVAAPMSAPRVDGEIAYATAVMRNENSAQSAALTNAPNSSSPLPWAGLVSVLALGSVGTYLYTRRSVTKAEAREFDIL